MKKNRWTFILMVTAVVISGISFSLYVKSKISAINTLRTSVTMASKKIADATEGKTAQLETLRLLFPETGDTTEFIESMYRISKRRNIVNLKFEQKSREYIEAATGRPLRALPATGQKTGLIYSYPVKISFNSGYRDMAEFIREMQNQERLVTIESLNVKRDKDFLAAEMIVNIYSAGER
ncbi:MAG: type 4a pilus biogenesis protein PilO [Nitrospirota bacterium]